MNGLFERSALLLSDGAIEKLKRARVAVFGLGGVGGFAVEALARAGVGTLALVDSDRVSDSNRNRQIYALSSTVGLLKTEVARERVKEINPACNVRTFTTFYLPENADEIDLSQYDYIVDAIDTVSAKIELAARASALGVPIVSCMGTGNKLNPQLLKLSDLAKTKVCPLARVMRRELKKRGIEHLNVVYSEEEPIPVAGNRVPGSVSFVPPVAGFLLASKVIKDLIE